MVVTRNRENCFQQLRGILHENRFGDRSAVILTRITYSKTLNEYEIKVFIQFQLLTKLVKTH